MGPVHVRRAAIKGIWNWEAIHWNSSTRSSFQSASWFLSLHISQLRDTKRSTISTGISKIFWCSTWVLLFYKLGICCSSELSTVNPRWCPPGGSKIASSLSGCQVSANLALFVLVRIIWINHDGDAWVSCASLFDLLSPRMQSASVDTCLSSNGLSIWLQGRFGLLVLSRDRTAAWVNEWVNDCSISSCTVSALLWTHTQHMWKCME